MRTQSELQEKRDSVYENDDSKYPAMTYEQGVADALDWALDETSEDLEI